jgi:hypothetical protein
MRKIKCVLATLSNDGQPDLFFCEVIASHEDLEMGHHYDAVRQLGEENGYDVNSSDIVFDEDSPAFVYFKDLHPATFIND